MSRYINMCLIFVGMSILFVGLPKLVNAEEECEVIADKLVNPDEVSAEINVPKTKIKSVKLSVEQSPIELKTECET
jgi:hypothetical protein